MGLTGRSTRISSILPSLHSIVQNHAFVDGNKRTGLLTMHMFLTRSGYQLNVKDEDPALEQVILGVARSEIGFDELASWLEDRIVRSN